MNLPQNRNIKTLFSTLCIYMEKFDKGEITENQSNAMCKLINTANSLITTEIRRAAGMCIPGFSDHYRSIELSSFDSIKEHPQKQIESDRPRMMTKKEKLIESFRKKYPNISDKDLDKLLSIEND